MLIWDFCDVCLFLTPLLRFYNHFRFNGKSCIPLVFTWLFSNFYRFGNFMVIFLINVLPHTLPFPPKTSRFSVTEIGFRGTLKIFRTEGLDFAVSACRSAHETVCVSISHKSPPQNGNQKICMGNDLTKIMVNTTQIRKFV